MKFKEKLKQLRIQHNLKQSDIAELCSVTRSAVSNWESGLRFPEIESVTILAKFFNISIEELLGTDQTIMNLKEIEKDISDTNNKISKKVPMMLAISWVVVFALLLILIAPVVKDKYTNIKDNNTVDIIDVETIEKVQLDLILYDKIVNIFFNDLTLFYDNHNSINNDRKYVIENLDIQKLFEYSFWGDKQYIDFDIIFLLNDNKCIKIRDTDISIISNIDLFKIYDNEKKIYVRIKYQLVLYISNNKYYLEAFLLD